MAIILQVAEQDFKIEVNIGVDKEIIDIRKCMRIDENSLIKEYMEQPAFFAWYAALMADQEDKLATLKRNQMRHHAELAMKIRRGEIKPFGEAKYTENAIREYIESERSNRVMQEEIDIQEAVCKKLDVLVKASIQRKEMLIQLGFLRRQEMKQAEMGQ